MFWLLRVTVPVVPDPFVSLVDEARRRLTRQEGREVSVREVIRRAGYSEAERAKISYHLADRPRRGAHRVPHELVERLAEVLPVSYDELRRAALEAGGYNVVEATPTPDVLGLVTRYLDADDVDEAEKAETSRRLLEEIARRMTGGSR